MLAKIKDKFKLRSTFTKVIVSYLLLVVMILSILSVILYYRFMKTSLDVIELNSSEKLGQSINISKFIRNHIYASGIQLMNDEVVKPVIYNDNISILDQYNLSMKIRKAMYSDPIIHSIYIYNSKADVLFSNVDSFKKVFLDVEMRQLLSKYNNISTSPYIPIKVKYQDMNGKNSTENIISVIFSDLEYSNNTGNTNSNHLNSSLIINLKADDIQTSIASSVQDDKLNTLIMDEEGTVIFDSTLDGFSSNKKSSEYIKEIMNSKVSEGINIRDVDGSKSLVVYKRMEEIGWIFVSISPFKSLFSKFYALKLTIIFICLIIFLVALGLSLFSARSIFLPFNKLLDKLKNEAETPFADLAVEMRMNDIQYLTHTFNGIRRKTHELETSMQDQIPIIKNTLLRKVILGNLDSDSGIILNKMFESFFIEADDVNFIVVIFAIDNYNNFKEMHHLSDQNIIKSSIEIHVMNILSEAFSCELLEFDEQYFHIVFRTGQGKVSSEVLQNYIQRIQTSIKQSIAISVSAAVGQYVNCVGDIHISYNTAFDMIKYRFITGRSSIFCYGIDNIGASMGIRNLDKQKERLFQAIRSSNIERSEIEVDNIFNEISELQYDYVMLEINQLILDIAKSVGRTDENDRGEGEEFDFNNIYHNINRIDTLDEVKGFFKLYCRGLISRLARKKSNVKEEVFIEILDYLKNNFQNYDLSAESIGKMANLTPGYFGKMFTDYTGKTINEYILGLRLEEAKKLLISTESAVLDISSKIGFNSTTYFNTVFKKTYGYTPNQFRLESKRNSTNK